MPSIHAQLILHLESDDQLDHRTACREICQANAKPTCPKICLRPLAIPASVPRSRIYESIIGVKLVWGCYIDAAEWESEDSNQSCSRLRSRGTCVLCLFALILLNGVPDICACIVGPRRGIRDGHVDTRSWNP